MKTGLCHRAVPWLHGNSTLPQLSRTESEVFRSQLSDNAHNDRVLISIHTLPEA